MATAVALAHAQGGAADGELIPGLPEDIAMECLLRVSYKCHPQLLGVCRRWERLVSGHDFYEQRRRAGTTSQAVCLVQALPAPVVGKLLAAPVYAVAVYDVRTGSWDKLPLIPELPQGMPLFCQAVGHEGTLFVLGGWNPTTWEAMKTVYAFNFSTRSWTRCADMLNVRSFFACAAGGGKIYVAGGHDDSKNALTSAEVFSIASNRWEMIPPLSQGRDECSGYLLNSRFHVVSGYPTDSQGRFVRSADVYDPATSSWERIEDFWPIGVCPCALVVANSCLYSFYLQKMFRYQPASNSWAQIDGVPEGGWFSPHATAAQGSIFLTGSVEGRGSGLLYRPLKAGGGDFGVGEVGEWVTLDREPFQNGLTHSSCTVEI